MKDVTPEWLREQMGGERGAQAKLAAHLGLTAPKMSLVMSGKRRLTSAEALKVVEYFGVSASETVPVVAYVGAGAEVYSIDDHAKGEGFDRVEAPPGVGGNAIAVIVRGDSMYPAYKDGDVLIYDAEEPPADLIGKDCVVEVEDGRVLVKTIRRGAGDCFTLVSHNAADIEDVYIRRASRVKVVLKG
jgi:phage repressor protein C with HTH and peptisase S24 domain